MAAGESGADDSRPKVSLSGTIGRGKSTLLRPLAARLDVVAFDELARRFLDGGHDLSSATVQAAITIAQAEREATRPAFVTDRSLIDALAYARIGLAVSEPASLEYEVFGACVSWCESHLRGRYTHVIVVESDIDLPPHLRGRERFRDAVAREVWRAIDDAGVPALSVDGSVEDNVRRAATWIADGAASSTAS